VNPRVLAGLLTVALVGYFLLLTRQALAFIGEGGYLAVLGAAILVLPLIGCYVVVREWQFGRRVQGLAEHLARSGELPADDLPKRASGRPDREAADARFAERAEEVHAAPADPGAWFRLAVAYDDAGDRKRARAAMRTAVALYGQRSKGAQRS
jgi:cytochrome c-type biogenesis protein CcmH/NrfG